jgi:hypothetical protein
MLYAAGALAFLLLVYSTLLVQIRVAEHERARASKRSPREGARQARVTYPDGFAEERVYTGGNGHGYASTYGNGHGHRPPGRRAVGNGHPRPDKGATYVQVSSDGLSRRVAPDVAGAARTGNASAPGTTGLPFDVAAIQILDDDVHVVIRRPGEVEGDPAVPSAAAR